MHLNITFDTVENCANAASFLKVPVADGATAIDISWDSLAAAKAMTGVVNIDQLDDSPVEFIVQCDITDPKVTALIDSSVELGDGFYHVTSANGLELANVVTSLDPVDIINVGVLDVTTPLVVSGKSVIDPLGAEGQWARIRVASTYRPLLTSFTYYDNVVTKSKPELYVLDTGINWDHQEFANIEHDDFFKASICPDFSDEVGHGTGVASCAAGFNVGIARNIKLRNVKLFNNDSTVTTNISLLDVHNAITAIIDEVAKNPNVSRVANMSWAMPKNSFVESRITALVNAGVTVVTAAGNTGTDIELITPAGMSNVLTVGAIDKYDIPAGFNNIAPSDSGLTTNYGLYLDMFAPGDNVVIADASDPTGYVMSSGTSFSAGYVSGVAAETASLFPDNIPHPLLMEKLIDLSTKDAILFDDERFSPNENKIIHLISAMDTQADALDLYMGAFTSATEEINLDSNTIIDVTPWTQLNPDSAVVWSVSYEDAATEADYGSFINIDPVTGYLTVTKPTVDLPENETINMVRFKIHATHDSIVLDSPWMFFFQVDGTIDESVIENDITRALSETNSTSCFITMGVLK